MERQVYRVLDAFDTLKRPLSLSAGIQILRRHGFTVKHSAGFVEGYRQIFGQHVASYRLESIILSRRRNAIGGFVISVTARYSDLRLVK